MKHLIFHLNVLVEREQLRKHIQEGIAQMLGEIYGDREAWFSAYTKVRFDWDSYHADLNFSGEDGMADMREARFRVMRALFRIVGQPEPSVEEIHALADKTLTIRWGDLFGHYSNPLIQGLAEQYAISLVSYFPQIQVEAIIKGANLQEYIKYCVGTDTFEQYDMNQRYFEMLLNRLQAKPEDCLYIDKQTQVLEVASQLNIKTFFANPNWHSRIMAQELKNFLAKEFPK